MLSVFMGSRVPSFSQALPVLALWEHVTSVTCRDAARTAQARVVRLRALTDLGLFSEAFALLQVNAKPASSFWGRKAEGGI